MDYPTVTIYMHPLVSGILLAVFGFIIVKTLAEIIP